MTTESPPTWIDDPVNAGILAHSEDRLAGFQRDPFGAIAERSGIAVEVVLERIVAEEREAKGKMPRYPGLERWNLIEKMGDGAFSNVYRARDSHGQWGEVAIKVVRKFEMNSQQVSTT